MIPYFCRKLEKMSQNLSSATVVIGALRVKWLFSHLKKGQVCNSELLTGLNLLSAAVMMGSNWASSRENLSSGIPTKPVSSQSLQLQSLARKLQFHL